MKSILIDCHGRAGTGRVCSFPAGSLDEVWIYYRAHKSNRTCQSWNRFLATNTTAGYNLQCAVAQSGKQNDTFNYSVCVANAIAHHVFGILYGRRTLLFDIEWNGSSRYVGTVQVFEVHPELLLWKTSRPTPHPIPDAFSWQTC